MIANRRANTQASDLPSDERQRIDKWLWHARVVRTRSAAAALAASGHVRLNGARIDAPAKAVKAGDVVTIALDARVRVLKVPCVAPRRGAAEAGRALYDDLTPVDPPRSDAEGPAPGAARRDPGSGRPTKQDWRSHRGSPAAVICDSFRAFSAKWMPVRRGKRDQIGNLEPVRLLLKPARLSCDRIACLRVVRSCASTSASRTKLAEPRDDLHRQ